MNALVICINMRNGKLSVTLSVNSGKILAGFGCGQRALVYLKKKVKI